MRLDFAAIAVVVIAGCGRDAGSAVPLELASARGVTFDVHAVAPPPGYDPLALAAASRGPTANPNPTIPAQCYTRTDGTWNPCASCHTGSTYPNLSDDWELQHNYPFLSQGNHNPWRNLFRDRQALVARFSDDDVLGYVRRDNYAPLRAALAARPGFPGWRADLEFRQGFSRDGFANDGSGWRAIRYKPFPGAFWPTNGSAGDVFVRLPDDFQRDARGDRSLEIYRTNLAILEAAIASDPRRRDAEVVRVVEPLDEQTAGVDLDRDGKLGIATAIVGLPASFVGRARGIAVVRALYPAGVEFLHTVRYLDPDAADLASHRMKEVRYARKVAFYAERELARAYKQIEASDAPYQGDPQSGFRNPLGWQLQGWIEDARGWLRLQTHEEHQLCMGCHSNLGVTVDQTFAFARKLPGGDGWRPQNPRGIADAPQVGHSEPEYAEYLMRVGGGDELRANADVQRGYFRAGQLDRERAAAMREDIAKLVFPSRARAIALDRAYLANVIEQSYVWGRDPIVSPAPTVHHTVGERSTGLGESGHVYRDARLHLDW